VTTLILSVLMPACFLAAGASKPIEVCTLVKSASAYDRTTVVVTGFVFAGRHATGIKGEGCSHGVIIRYDVNSVPKEFALAVEGKRLGLDRRPLRVTVEGKFSHHVRAPLGFIDRIEVSKVLCWKFIGEKKQRVRSK
jgi:hypothetical protein